MPKQTSYTATLTVNVTGSNGTRTYTKQVENMVKPKVGVLVEAGPFSGRATKVDWSDQSKSVTIENEADTVDDTKIGEDWTAAGPQLVKAASVKEKPATKVEASGT